MAERRKIRGKKLLVVSAGIVGASMLGCSDETVANLVAPPVDASSADAMPDAPSRDADLMDAPVANLLPPPDSSFEDAAELDGSADDGSTDDGG